MPPGSISASPMAPSVPRSARSAPALASSAYPSDLAIDGTGNLYVAEPTRVQVFDPDLRLASVWQAPAGAQQYPEDWLALAAADDGTMYVGVPRDDPCPGARRRARARCGGRDGPRDRGFRGTGGSVPDRQSIGDPGPGGRMAIGSAAPISSPIPFTAQLPPGWRLNWLQALGGTSSWRSRGLATRTAPSGTCASLWPRTHSSTPAGRVRRTIRPAHRPRRRRPEPPCSPTYRGFRLTSPLTDVTLSGFAGQQLDSSTRSTAGCATATLAAAWTFDDAGRQAWSRRPAGTPSSASPVLDVRGTRVLVEARTFHEYDAAPTWTRRFRMSNSSTSTQARPPGDARGHDTARADPLERGPARLTLQCCPSSRPPHTRATTCAPGPSSPAQGCHPRRPLPCAPAEPRRPA